MAEQFNWDIGAPHESTQVDEAFKEIDTGLQQDLQQADSVYQQGSRVTQPEHYHSAAASYFSEDVTAARRAAEMRRRADLQASNQQKTQLERQRRSGDALQRRISNWNKKKIFEESGIEHETDPFGVITPKRAPDGTLLFGEETGDWQSRSLEHPMDDYTPALPAWSRKREIWREVRDAAGNIRRVDAIDVAAARTNGLKPDPVNPAVLMGHILGEEPFVAGSIWDLRENKNPLVRQAAEAAVTGLFGGLNDKVEETFTTDVNENLLLIDEQRRQLEGEAGKISPDDVKAKTDFMQRAADMDWIYDGLSEDKPLADRLKINSETHKPSSKVDSSRRDAAEWKRVVQEADGDVGLAYGVWRARQGEDWDESDPVKRAVEEKQWDWGLDRSRLNDEGIRQRLEKNEETAHFAGELTSIRQEHREATIALNEEAAELREPMRSVGDQMRGLQKLYGSLAQQHRGNLDLAGGLLGVARSSDEGNAAFSQRVVAGLLRSKNPATKAKVRAMLNSNAPIAMELNQTKASLDTIVEEYNIKKGQYDAWEENSYDERIGPFIDKLDDWNSRVEKAMPNESDDINDLTDRFIAAVTETEATFKAGYGSPAHDGQLPGENYNQWKNPGQATRSELRISLDKWLPKHYDYIRKEYYLPYGENSNELLRHYEGSAEFKALAEEKTGKTWAQLLELAKGTRAYELRQNEWLRGREESLKRDAQGNPANPQIDWSRGDGKSQWTYWDKQVGGRLETPDSAQPWNRYEIATLPTDTKNARLKGVIDLVLGKIGEHGFYDFVRGDEKMRKLLDPTGPMTDDTGTLFTSTDDAIAEWDAQTESHRKNIESIYAKHGIPPEMWEGMFQQTQAMHAVVSRPEAWNKIVDQRGLSKIPYLGSGKVVAEFFKIAESAQRLENGGKDASQEDIYRVMNYIRFMSSNKTAMAGFVDISTELPAFAFEISSSAGLSTVGRAMTKTAFKKTLGKWLKKDGQKYLGELLFKKIAHAAKQKGGKAAALRFAARNIDIGFRAPAMGGRSWAHGLQEMLPGGVTFSKNELGQLEAMITEEQLGEQSALKAAAKGTTSLFWELWTETIGGHYISKPVNYVGAKAGKVLKKWFRMGKNHRMYLGQRALLAMYFKNNKRASVKSLKAIMKRSGYHGVVTEIGEEHLNRILQPATEALIDGGGLGGAWEAVAENQTLLESATFGLVGDPQKRENSMAEWVSFAMWPGARAVASLPGITKMSSAQAKMGAHAAVAQNREAENSTDALTAVAGKFHNRASDVSGHKTENFIPSLLAADEKIEKKNAESERVAREKKGRRAKNRAERELGQAHVERAEIALNIRAVGEVSTALSEIDNFELKGGTKEQTDHARTVAVALVKIAAGQHDTITAAEKKALDTKSNGDKVDTPRYEKVGDHWVINQEALDKLRDISPAATVVAPLSEEERRANIKGAKMRDDAKEGKSPAPQEIYDLAVQARDAARAAHGAVSSQYKEAAQRVNMLAERLGFDVPKAEGLADEAVKAALNGALAVEDEPEAWDYLYGTVEGLQLIKQSRDWLHENEEDVFTLYRGGKGWTLVKAVAEEDARETGETVETKENVTPEDVAFVDHILNDLPGDFVDKAKEKLEGRVVLAKESLATKPVSAAEEHAERVASLVAILRRSNEDMSDADALNIASVFLESDAAKDLTEEADLVLAFATWIKVEKNLERALASKPDGQAQVIARDKIRDTSDKMVDELVELYRQTFEALGLVVVVDEGSYEDTHVAPFSMVRLLKGDAHGKMTINKAQVAAVYGVILGGSPSVLRRSIEMAINEEMIHGVDQHLFSDAQAASLWLDWSNAFPAQALALKRAYAEKVMTDPGNHAYKGRELMRAVVQMHLFGTTTELTHSASSVQRVGSFKDTETGEKIMGLLEWRDQITNPTLTAKMRNWLRAIANYIRRITGRKEVDPNGVLMERVRRIEEAIGEKKFGEVTVGELNADIESFVDGISRSEGISNVIDLIEENRRAGTSEVSPGINLKGELIGDNRDRILSEGGLWLRPASGQPVEIRPLREGDAIILHLRTNPVAALESQTTEVVLGVVNARSVTAKQVTQALESPEKSLGVFQVLRVQTEKGVINLDGNPELAASSPVLVAASTPTDAAAIDMTGREQLLKEMGDKNSALTKDGGKNLNEIEKTVEKMLELPEGTLEFVRSGNSLVFRHKGTGQFVKFDTVNSIEWQKDIATAVAAVSPSLVADTVFKPFIWGGEIKTYVALQAPVLGEVRSMDVSKADLKLLFEASLKSPLFGGPGKGETDIIETDPLGKNMGVVLEDGVVKIVAFDLEGMEKLTADQLASLSDVTLEGVSLEKFSPKFQEKLKGLDAANALAASKPGSTGNTPTMGHLASDAALPAELAGINGVQLVVSDDEKDGNRRRAQFPRAEARAMGEALSSNRFAYGGKVWSWTAEQATYVRWMPVGFTPQVEGPTPAAVLPPIVLTEDGAISGNMDGVKAARAAGANVVPVLVPSGRAKNTFPLNVSPNEMLTAAENFGERQQSKQRLSVSISNPFSVNAENPASISLAEPDFGPLMARIAADIEEDHPELGERQVAELARELATDKALKTGRVKPDSMVRRFLSGSGVEVEPALARLMEKGDSVTILELMAEVGGGQAVHRALQNMGFNGLVVKRGDTTLMVPFSSAQVSLPEKFGGGLVAADELYASKPLSDQTEKELLAMTQPSGHHHVVESSKGHTDAQLRRAAISEGRKKVTVVRQDSPEVVVPVMAHDTVGISEWVSTVTAPLSPEEAKELKLVPEDMGRKDKAGNLTTKLTIDVPKFLRHVSKNHPELYKDAPALIRDGGWKVKIARGKNVRGKTVDIAYVEMKKVGYSLYNADTLGGNFNDYIRLKRVGKENYYKELRLRQLARNTEKKGVKGYRKVKPHTVAERKTLVDDFTEQAEAKEHARRRRVAAKRMVKFFKTMLRNPQILKAFGWYSEIQKEFALDFGGGARFFTELLGATSARTDVGSNFDQSKEAARMYTSGKYDVLLGHYRDHVLWVESLLPSDSSPEGDPKQLFSRSTPMFKMWREQNPTKSDAAYAPHKFIRRLINDFHKNETNKGVYRGPRDKAGQPVTLANTVPLKANGTKFNANSEKVLNVLFGNWHYMSTGPKTPNFANNLAGLSRDATIDMWAARTLRRIIYGGDSTWHIVKHPRGHHVMVFGEPEIDANGKLQVRPESGFRKWRILPDSEKGVDSTVLADGTKSGDFYFGQEVFAEASDMLSVDGTVMKFLMQNVPSVGLSGRVMPDDLQAFAWFAEKHFWDLNDWTDNQGRVKSSFGSTLDESNFRRYVTGVTTFNEWEKFDDFARQNFRARGKQLRDAISKQPGLMLAMVTDSVGMFWGAMEPTYNAQWTTDDADPDIGVLEEVVDIGRSSNQFEVHYGAVVPEDHPNARPVMEVQFTRPMSHEGAAAIYALLSKAGVMGMTLLTDQQNRYTGMTIAWIPEYEFSEHPDEITPQAITESRARFFAMEARLTALFNSPEGEMERFSENLRKVGREAYGAFTSLGFDKAGKATGRVDRKNFDTYFDELKKRHPKVISEHFDSAGRAGASVGENPIATTLPSWWSIRVHRTKVDHTPLIQARPGGLDNVVDPLLTSLQKELERRWETLYAVLPTGERSSVQPNHYDATGIKKQSKALRGGLAPITTTPSTVTRGTTLTGTGKSAARGYFRAQESGGDVSAEAGAAESRDQWIGDRGAKVFPTPDFIDVSPRFARKVAVSWSKITTDPAEATAETKAAFERLSGEIRELYQHWKRSGVVIVTSLSAPDTTEGMVQGIQWDNRFEVQVTNNPHALLSDPVEAGSTLTVYEALQGLYRYYGHAATGAQLSAAGHEQAWVSVAPMFTAMAQRALSVVTRSAQTYDNFRPELWTADNEWRGNYVHPNYVDSASLPVSDFRYGLMSKELGADNLTKIFTRQSWDMRHDPMLVEQQLEEHNLQAASKPVFEEMTPVDINEAIPDYVADYNKGVLMLPWTQAEATETLLGLIGAGNMSTATEVLNLIHNRDILRALSLNEAIPEEWRRAAWTRRVDVGRVEEAIEGRFPITQHPAILEWSKGNVIIDDETGEAKRLFHSTNTRFGFFNLVGSNEIGFHAGSEGQAKAREIRKTRYVGSSYEKTYMLELIGRSANPLRLQDDGDFFPETIAPQLLTLGIITPKELKLVGHLARKESRPMLTTAIRKAGFDSIVYLNRVESWDTDRDAVGFNGNDMLRDRFLNSSEEAEIDITEVDDDAFRELMANAFGDHAEEMLEDSHIFFAPSDVKSPTARFTNHPNFWMASIPEGHSGPLVDSLSAKTNAQSVVTSPKALKGTKSPDRHPAAGEQGGAILLPSGKWSVAGLPVSNVVIADPKLGHSSAGEEQSKLPFETKKGESWEAVSARVSPGMDVQDLGKANGFREVDPSAAVPLDTVYLPAGLDLSAPRISGSMSSVDEAATVPEGAVAIAFDPYFSKDWTLAKDPSRRILGAERVYLTSSPAVAYAEGVSFDDNVAKDAVDDANRQEKHSKQEEVEVPEQVAAGLREMVYRELRTARVPERVQTNVEVFLPSLTHSETLALIRDVNSDIGYSWSHFAEGIPSPALAASRPSYSPEPGFYSRLHSAINQSELEVFKGVTSPAVTGRSFPAKTIKGKDGKIIKEIAARKEADTPAKTTTVEDIITRLTTEAGVSPEEIKWSGIMTWLAGQEGPVSKGQVLIYLENEGKVEFKENLLVDKVQPLIWEKEEDGGAVGSMDTGQHAVFIAKDPVGGKYKIEPNTNSYSYDPRDFDTLEQAVESASETWDRLGNKGEKRPSHGTQVLSGGENYREMILTVPRPPTYHGPNDAPNPADVTTWISDANTFTSSHYPSFSNYVAHIRMNDRYIGTSYGTFIEEIQSDRHQKGRKRGYATKSVDPVKFEELVNNANDILEDLDYLGFDNVQMARRGIVMHDDWAERWDVPDEHQRLMLNRYRKASLANASSKHGVPDAPFRQSRDWGLHMFKRALRDAVTGKRDWIGWASGDVHNDRYSLSTRVEELFVERKHWSSPTSGFEDTYSVEIIPKGERGDAPAQKRYVGKFSEAELGGVIGKEMAERVVKDLEEVVEGPTILAYSGLEEVAEGSASRVYSGLDLKVGGKGMRRFYDEILVNEIRAYVKQWGGKVREDKVDVLEEIDEREAMEILGEGPGFEDDKKAYDEMTQEERDAFLDRARAIKYQANNAWIVDITPQMAESVANAGQSLMASLPGDMTPQEMIKAAKNFRFDPTAKNFGFDRALHADSKGGVTTYRAWLSSGGIMLPLPSGEHHAMVGVFNRGLNLKAKPDLSYDQFLDAYDEMWDKGYFRVTVSNGGLHNLREVQVGRGKGIKPQLKRLLEDWAMHNDAEMTFDNTDRGKKVVIGPGGWDAGNIFASRPVEEVAAERGFNYGPVQHGTAAPKFRKFDKGAGYRGGMHPSRSLGYFFAESEFDQDAVNESRGYARQAARLMGGHRLDERFPVTAWLSQKMGLRGEEAPQPRVEPFFLKLENPYRMTLDQLYAIQSEREAEDLKIQLQGAGYDGVVAKGGEEFKGDPVWEVIVFDPGQIKSAEQVTFDEDGKKIPMGSRFDEDSNDMYAASTPHEVAELAYKMAAETQNEMFADVQQVITKLFTHSPLGDQWQDGIDKAPMALMAYYLDKGGEHPVLANLAKHGKLFHEALLGTGDEIMKGESYASFGGKNIAQALHTLKAVTIKAEELRTKADSLKGQAASVPGGTEADSEYLALAEDTKKNAVRLREMLNERAASLGALVRKGSPEFVRGGFEKGITEYEGSSFWTTGADADVAESYAEDSDLGLGAIPRGRRTLANERLKKVLRRASTPEAVLRLFAHQMVFSGYSTPNADWDQTIDQNLDEITDRLTTEEKLEEAAFYGRHKSRADLDRKVKLYKEGKYSQIINEEPTDTGWIFLRNWDLGNMRMEVSDLYTKSEFKKLEDALSLESNFGDLRGVNHAYLFIKNPAESRGTGEVTPETMQAAKDAGHDGMVSEEAVGGGLVNFYKSSRTERSAEVVAFEPHQVKSFDLVTRDATGKIIPLSQRFDPGENALIRASVPGDEAFEEWLKRFMARVDKLGEERRMNAPDLEVGSTVYTSTGREMTYLGYMGQNKKTGKKSVGVKYIDGEGSEVQTSHYLDDIRLERPSREDALVSMVNQRVRSREPLHKSWTGEDHMDPASRLQMETSLSIFARTYAAYTYDQSEINNAIQAKRLIDGFEEDGQAASVPTEDEVMAHLAFMGEKERILRGATDLKMGAINPMAKSPDRRFHLNTVASRFLLTLMPKVYMRMHIRFKRLGKPMPDKYHTDFRRMVDAGKVTMELLADLTATLPEEVGEDLVNQNNDDPYAPMKEAFPDGTKRGLSEILDNLLAVTQWAYSDPSPRSGVLRDVLNVVELLSDFGYDVSQEIQDKVHRAYDGHSWAESAAIEAKAFADLMNTEFNDVEDTGGGFKVTPIDPDVLPASSPLLPIVGGAVHLSGGKSGTLTSISHGRWNIQLAEGGALSVHGREILLGASKPYTSALTPDQIKTQQMRVGDAADARTTTQKMLSWWRRHVARLQTRLTVGAFDSAAVLREMESDYYGDVQSGADSAWKAVQLTKNLATVMDGILHKGQLKWDGTWFAPIAGTEGLLDILKPILGNDQLTQDWEYYVAAKRSQQLLKEGREHNFGLDREAFEAALAIDPDADAMAFWDKKRAAAEIKEALALAKANPEFEVVRKKYVAFQKNLLNLAEGAGLINSGDRKAWESSFYVPFYRIREAIDEEPMSSKGPSKSPGIASQSANVKRLRGGYGRVAIIENIYRNAEALIDASFKNAAMRKLVTLATLTDSGIEKVPHKADATKVEKEELVERIRRENDTAADALGNLLDDDTQLEFWRMLAPQGDGIVTVMVGGKRQYFKVVDPLVTAAIGTLGPDATYGALEPLLKVGGWFKRSFTELVTLDPSFLVANFLRDTAATWVQTEGKMIPLWSAGAGFKEAFREGPTMELIGLVGGGGGTYHNLTQKHVRKRFKKLAAEGEQSFAMSVVTSPKHVWKVYRDLQRAAENANRVAVANKVLAEGGSSSEAVFQAMDVLNFTSHGSNKLLQIAIRLLPFLNARLQGLYKLSRAAGTQKGKDEAVNMFVRRGAIVAGLTLALWAMNYDDDRYWQLDDWDRDLYWHIWIGKVHIRIPKPFEIGVMFATSTERLMEFMWGNGPKGDKGVTRGNPDFAMVGNFVSHSLRDTFALDPVPQVYRPFYELNINKNRFLDRTILQPWEIQQDKPESEFSAYTSPVVREVAGVMPDVAPRWMRSPKQLEHIYRGYTGSIGAYVTAVGDEAIRTANPKAYGSSAKVGVERVPLVNKMMYRFFPDDSMKMSRFYGDFYDLWSDVSDKHSGYQKHLEAGEVQEATKFLQKHQLRLTYYSRLKSQYRVISGMNDQRKAILADPVMGREDKRAMLQQLVVETNRLSEETVRQFQKDEANE